jgi:hypothetical protein
MKDKNRYAHILWRPIEADDVADFEAQASSPEDQQEDGAHLVFERTPNGSLINRGPRHTQLPAELHRLQAAQ